MQAFFLQNPTSSESNPYCRPVSLTHEGIDSVVPPNIGFQMTVSSECTAPADYLRKLHNTLLKPNEKLRCYYVVPKPIFTTFKLRISKEIKKLVTFFVISPKISCITSCFVLALIDLI